MTYGTSHLLMGGGGGGGVVSGRVYKKYGCVRGVTT